MPVYKNGGIMCNKLAVKIVVIVKWSLKHQNKIVPELAHRKLRTNKTWFLNPKNKKNILK